mgnify:CR=1 FL=1
MNEFDNLVINNMFLYDFDNGLKYLKCGLHGLLDNMDRQNIDRKDVKGVSIEAIICAAKVCDDIHIYQNRLNIEILLRWDNNNMIYLIKQDDNSITVEKFKTK